MSDSFFNIPSDISDHMRSFQSEVESLAQSFKMIESFSGDYFMTLSQSGFRELNEIVDALNASLHLCDRIMRARRFDDTRSVIKYVYIDKGMGQPPSILTNEFAQTLPLLENWADKFRVIIDAIDKNVKEASRKYKDVGVIRKRNREPTTIILGEVRRKILGSSTVAGPNSKKIPTF